MKNILTIDVSVSVIVNDDEAQYLKEHPEMVVFDDIADVKKVVKQAKVVDSEHCDETIDAVKLLTERYRKIGL